MGYATPRTTPTVIQTARGLIDGRPFGIVSVTEFGAVGDGVTDDTDAIQAAIDACAAAGGGVVYLPPGVYGLGKGDVARLTGPFPKHSLELVTGVSIHGAGMGASILKVLDSTPADTPILWGTAVTDVTLADFAIDGNKQRFPPEHSFGPEDEGVDIKGASKRIYLARLHIHDCGGDGIDIDDGDIADTLYVVDCIIEDNGGPALHNGMVNTTVRNCIIRRNSHDRAVLDAGNSCAMNFNHDNARVDGCTIEGNYSGVVTRTNPNGFVLANTRIQTTVGSCFATAAPITNAVITGCDMELNATTGKAISANIPNGIIENCSVKTTVPVEAFPEAIGFSGVNAQVRNCRVSGGYVGIQATTDPGLSVIGNTVTGTSGTHGVRMQSSGMTRGIVANNIITGYTNAVAISSGPTNVLVIGNVYNGNMTNDSGATVSGNRAIT